MPARPFTIAIVLASQLKYLLKSVKSNTNLTSALTDRYKYTMKNEASDLESSMVQSETGTVHV